jgi:cobalt-zinc-cadmium efflux system outer membrane protein
LVADVLDWLVKPLRTHMAAHEMERTKRRVSHEVLEMAAHTKAAFYTVQADAQFLQKLQLIAEVHDATADLAKRLKDAGNINELELLTQQTGAQQGAVDLKRAEGELAAARAKLNRLLGLADARTNWKVVPALPNLPEQDPALGKTESLAIARRQDLAAAREHLAAVGAAVEVKRKTRFIPGLNVGIDTERESAGGHLTGPTVDLELPVFNWGKADLLQLQAEQRQMQAETEALENEVRNDVQSAHAAMRAARNVCEYQQTTLLPQRQRILSETLLHYNAMQKSNFELLLAKSEEQRAEQESIEALRDYWLARTELEQAAGGILEGKPVSQTGPTGNARPHEEGKTPQP